MRVVTKACIILLFAFFARTLLSCCDCPAEPGKAYYSIDAINLTTLDNSGSNPMAIETGGIPKEAFGILIRYTTTIISRNSFLNNSFFCSAQACSCIDPDMIPGEEFVITITTVNDFNDDYLAGSDVTALFRGEVGGKYYSLEEFSDDAEQLRVPEKIYLVTPPEIPGTHQFEIEITMANNRTVSASTRIVNLE